MHIEDDEHPMYFEGDAGPLTGVVTVFSVFGILLACIIAIVCNAEKIDLFFTNLLTR